MTRKAKVFTLLPIILSAVFFSFIQADARNDYEFLTYLMSKVHGRFTMEDVAPVGRFLAFTVTPYFWVTPAVYLVASTVIFFKRISVEQMIVCVSVMISALFILLSFYFFSLVGSYSGAFLTPW